MDLDNTPLKILHVLDHGPPLHSGYAFRSHNILRAQRKRGWQPIALTSAKHVAGAESHGGGKESIDGFTYYRARPASHGPTPLGAACRLMADLAKRIREVAEQEHPDLLHAHSPVLNALPAIWVGRRLGLPVVYEIRAFWEDAAVDHGTYREDSWQYRLVHAVESWVCRKVDQVAVICQGLKSDLIERGMPAEKIGVVANGIDLDAFHPCAPAADYHHAWGLGEKKVIGFIGSFYHYEGLDLLVEAIAQLTTARSDLALVLVGDGPMAAALKAHIDRLGLGKRVILAGKIPHDRVPGLYALMDILAYPRYSMRLTELVTPLKPLEAMAMRKALVASDIGGHRELIQHGTTGLLFPAGRIASLREALQSLLENPRLRQALEEQGASWVQRQRSWEKTTAVYSQIYARAFGESAPPTAQRPLTECSGSRRRASKLG